jgi:hypothetical protein
VLHVRRFHVEGVPKLALADSEEWDEGFSDALGDLDNAIEHVVIVPLELQFHPERRRHWEAVMRNVCLEASRCARGRSAPCGLSSLDIPATCPTIRASVEIARSFAKEHALLEMADHFADRFMSVAASKEELVRLPISSPFQKSRRTRAALEYINRMTGTCQKPIP